MKLAFTTLGCPEWDLDTILSKAVEYGFDAVDFRGYLGEMDIYNLPAFSKNIEETKEKFKRADLEVSCFSSSIRLFTRSEEELAAHLVELKQYLQLCRAFGTPYIRVFGGHIGKTPRKEAIETVVENLQEMLKIAEEDKVCLLLETHDDWTDCESILEVIERVNSPYLKVLWDVQHPYRLVQESPAKTWAALGKHIEYTHWKDSYLTTEEERGFQLCLVGEGDLPLQEMYTILKENGFDGYYTLEWEKVWWPAIEAPEIAFPTYVKFMRQLAASS